MARLTVCCVETGNYKGRGRDYVHALANGVRRHVTVPYRFACLTDNPDGLDDRIEVLTPPDGLKGSGWWNKLFLFSPGLFRDADRILFFDLDTIILKNIDDIASYDGGFAGMGNFRNGGWPFSSCMMAWQNGTMTHLWSDWNALGRPVTTYGDDEFIRNHEPNTAKLNRIFPGIQSYKFHKLKSDPKDARVVIFVQRPKPHDLIEDWVRASWTP